MSFFPDGLSEYSRITKSNINTLMSRIFTAAEEYKGEIDNEILNSVVQVQTLYQAKRDQQLKNKKTFKENIEEKKILRKLLARQLQINLFKLAIEYIGDFEKETLFFNSELLNKKTFNPGPNFKSNTEFKRAEIIDPITINYRIKGEAETPNNPSASTAIIRSKSSLPDKPEIKICSLPM